MTAIDFSETERFTPVGKEVQVVVETETESYLFALVGEHVLAYAPAGDFSLETRTTVECFLSPDDVDLQTLYDELSERVVKEYLDEKYRSDSD